MEEAKFGNLEFERRIFPRFVIHLPFSYELNGQPGEGVTHDVSQGGVQAYLPESVAEGDLLRLQMVLSKSRKVKALSALAKVVWQQKSRLPAPKNYKVGLVFVEISDETLKFIRWFERLWLKQKI